MIDRIDITVTGGNGGAGCVSFRREKYVPLGGPDGGDGGRGGSVLLIVVGSVRTLKEIGRKRIYTAGKGSNGAGGNRIGRGGGDVVIQMPRGTEVWCAGAEPGEWNRLADLLDAGQVLSVARGGRGGWGNGRFATSIHRAPRIAQRGQDGERRLLRLELKLLADIGLIGQPNAGKSTLLRSMSQARPKVADYPFTTLEPVLGVVDCGWQTFVAADLPGLIEGAHSGVGLGLEFLRHVERTKVIVHLVDGSVEEPLQGMELVNEELRRYGKRLGDRRQIVVVSKIDISEVSERQEELTRQFAARNVELLFVSGVTGEGVADLIQRLAAVLHELEDAPTEVRLEVKRPALIQRGVQIRREDDVFCVEGERVVVFAEMMPVEEEEGRAELWRRLKRWGVNSALRRAGAKPGDRVRLGAVELEYLG